MILIDSNVLMYAAGAPHRNKAASVRLLERIAEDEIEAVLDAEILQEILHRYRAIGRWEAGRQIFDLARRILPIVFPITAEVLDAARRLMDDHPRLAARDALHVGVCHEGGLSGICSFDRDFDQVRSLKRFEPAELL